ncbi:HNH endonuclease [Ensifer adhaerens]|uniref:HNH endonuclease n=1 Tax=Ensifer adhaerens TaxID=106592 RepID=UPI00132EAA38|nr:HNH endonuclease [Ensifer adhaerens]QHG74440.1 hypothetical protein DQW09_32140 [Ensifer adhaerens]
MARYRVPVRSSPAAQTNYRLYKADLRADFGQQCGYCSTPDAFLGGRSVYHIDHFAPHSKFPLLKLVYGNLVYACAFCNRSKSDKWIGTVATVSHDGTSGFVDPCTTEYDVHLDRDRSGRFVGLSSVGTYMVKNLRLDLLRHQHVWQCIKIKELRERLRAIKGKIEDVRGRAELLETIDSLTQAYEQFRDQIVES